MDFNKTNETEREEQHIQEITMKELNLQGMKNAKGPGDISIEVVKYAPVEVKGKLV